MTRFVSEYEMRLNLINLINLINSLTPIWSGVEDDCNCMTRFVSEYEMRLNLINLVSIRERSLPLADIAVPLKTINDLCFFPVSFSSA